MNRWMHLKLWVGAALAWLVLRLLGATYRVRVVEGETRIAELLSRREPVVFAFWHDSEFFFFHFLHRHFVRQGFPLSAMSSHSRVRCSAR